LTDKPKRRWYQFSLRLLLSLVTASCLFFWWDPLRLRPPLPVPIKTVPLRSTAYEDVIELNQQYDPQLGRSWQQVIFWSRYPDGKLHIREWKMTANSHTQDFQLDHSRRSLCTCSWSTDGIPFRVEAPTFRETKTSGDPELLDRVEMSKIDRQPLWK
jgi:hypothetical protein